MSHNIQFLFIRILKYSPCLCTKHRQGFFYSEIIHPVSTDYLANTVSGVLSCKLYTTDGNTLDDNGGELYAAGMLQVVKTTDEDGNASYTFTDKQERTVLTRQMNGPSSPTPTLYTMPRETCALYCSRSIRKRQI